LTDLFEDNAWANHVELGRWADVMLIAPASCNTIAKMAHGLCDNLLLSVYLSATCPVMIAPAMDEDMWHHPSTQHNLHLLRTYQNQIIPSEFGELASGLVGMGRMAEPETIFTRLNDIVSAKRPLEGISALVTAGPTYENIDPVRFIGNHSSGKMGISIAEQLANLGCTVHLVLGPSPLNPKSEGIHLTRVRSAQEMLEACTRIFSECRIAVMSAAVADYTPANVAEEKLKKKEDEMQIQLKKTTDILKHLGSVKTNQQILIGFALESNNERDYALQKLISKNADAIVLNSLQDSGAGFGHDTNKITIFERHGKEYSYPLKSKQEVAVDICIRIQEMLNTQ
jgi:phosphopantothenoylcysteine decarboxylase/phosphopantothenate--cysteine ligase